MTTIIYCHKTKKIACDSRFTCNGIITTDNAIKYKKTGDKVYFLSGDVSDYSRLVEASKNAENGQSVLIETAVSCSSIMAKNGSVFSVGITDSGQYWEEKLDQSHSIGSGSCFALAALDHGKSALDSVKYAMSRDMYSGGKIRVYDTQKGRLTRG